MTNNQLAENSVIQLLNSVKLARDNAERADNRVDHSFYYALTIALEELQERRKAAMDSEPVAWLRNPDQGFHLPMLRLGSKDPNPNFVNEEFYPVYAAPQPAPVGPVCTCPSGDGSLRWPCPVHPGYSPAIPDSARDALEKALAAMEFMGDTLNNLDAVCTEDVELVAPAFDAVRSVLAAALQEVK